MGFVPKVFSLLMISLSPLIVVKILILRVRVMDIMLLN